MTISRRPLSQLHLQMGQELIYLLMTSSLMAAFLLAIYIVHTRPLPGLAGVDPGYSVVDSPPPPPRSSALRLPKSGTTAPRTGIAPHLMLPNDSNLPPIITLSEAAGYKFALGSSQLSPAFRQQLHDQIVPSLLELVEKYGVTVIEVIGHTDEVPVRHRSASNLDESLLGFLDGRIAEDGGDSPLYATDNVGLGMARAAAVARALMDDSRMSGLVVLPLSAGQVILPNDTLSVGSSGILDDVSRRRLDIRLRRQQ